MMTEELKVTLRIVPPVALLDFEGKLVNMKRATLAQKTVMDAYHQACSNGAGKILINLTGVVGSINSTGVSFLISVLMEAKEREQQLGIVCCDEHNRRILEIVEISFYAPLYQSEDEGLKAMA
jgi:anti-anti-sigma factor